MTDIIELSKKEFIQKTNRTYKLNINGETSEYDIYKVNTDMLYYNDLNDRIATWISKYYSDPTAKDFNEMDVPERNRIIQKFIVESNPDKINKTKNNIATVGQLVPGVILGDGRVIDGNRRFTCLRMLREESPDDERFKYFETVIINADILQDRKMIKMLELSIQHGQDTKVEYDQVDLVIGAYKTIVEDKILDVSQYAISSNILGSKVHERLALAGLMNDYLNFINLPKQYYYLREANLYSLFVEMSKPLNKCKDDTEKEQMKELIFANYLVKSFVDVKKYLRDLSTIYGSEHYYNMCENEKVAIGKIVSDKSAIKEVKDIERFEKNHISIKDELTYFNEKAVEEFKKGKVKSSAKDNAKKCVTIIRDIDSRLFSKLSKEEKDELIEALNQLKKTTDRFLEELK